MRNLFQFISRYYFFFLFLLLFILAIIITGSRQHYQQALMWHSANKIAGQLHQARERVVSYFSLRQVNEKLLEENTQLRDQLEENFILSDDSVYIAPDTIYKRRFTYMHAGVINNSINRRNNHITLNKGQLHGIRPNMGIMTHDGVAGIITAVSENFSLAMSLLHSEVMLSVKIKKNEHIGSLQWEGENYRTAHMSYIPPHVDLQTGEEVVTSGLSAIFPENIPIGHITDWEIRRGESFYTARIELNMDFNTLSYVYIVKDLMQEELEDLQELVSPEI